MDKTLVVRPAVGAGLLLCLPLVMTMIDRHKPPGDGWHWSLLDFVVMGALLFAAGISHEFVSRKLRSRNWRMVSAAVIIMVVLAIWVQLAVGGISRLIDWITA